MNELLNIVTRLDGYTVDDLGFNVTEAEKTEGGTWKLKVNMYTKDGATIPPEAVCRAPMTMAERLYTEYLGDGDRRFVLLALKCEDDIDMTEFSVEIVERIGL